MDVSSGYRIPAWLLAAYALLTFSLGWFTADARNAWREQAAHAAPVNTATPAPKPASIGFTPKLNCDETKLVALRYSAHVWADEPLQRSVTLNGRQYRQGDALACGEEIVDIEPEVLIINAFGRYLRLHALTDWPGGNIAPLAIDEQPTPELTAAAESGEHSGQVADNAAGEPASSTAQGASPAAGLAAAAESGEHARQVADNAAGEPASSTAQGASPAAGLAAAAESGEHAGQVADNAASEPVASTAQGASRAAGLAAAAESGEPGGQVADNAAGEPAASTAQGVSAEAGHSAGMAGQYVASGVANPAETIGQTDAAATTNNEIGAGAAAVSDTLAGFVVSAAGVGKHSAATNRKASVVAGHADISVPGTAAAGGTDSAKAAAVLPGDNGEQADFGTKNTAVDGAADDADKQADASGLPEPDDDDTPLTAAEQASQQPAQAVAQLHAEGYTGERQP